jgi:hypothetical protein
MRLKTDLVILLSVFALFLGGSDIYKWVDEDGVVHYTDQPPGDQQSIEMDVPDEYGQVAAPQGESVYDEVIEEQRARREARTLEQEQESREREARQKEEALSEENCAKAIHYLNTLKRQCPVFYDGAGIMRAQCPGYFYSFVEGDRTYIEDDERAELIEHYSAVVNDCKEKRR